MQLLEFYESLPTIEQMPMFYVKGYTEALKTFTGVRVVPDPSFLQGISKEHEEYLMSVGFPFYFIPLIDHNNCYGYTLKGREKKTPRKEVKGSCLLPGYDEIDNEDTVVFLEGIKDAYLPRTAGLKTIPMCSSQIPTPLMRILATRKCRIVYCPDNDEHRNNSIGSFVQKAKENKLTFKVFELQGIKDFGEFFDSPEQRAIALAECKRLRKECQDGLRGFNSPNNNYQ